MDNCGSVGVHIIGKCSWKNPEVGEFEIGKFEIGKNQVKIWKQSTLQLRWEFSNFLLSNFILEFPTLNFPISRFFQIHFPTFRKIFLFYFARYQIIKSSIPTFYIFSKFRSLSFFIFSNYILQATVVTVYHQNKTF